MSMYNEADARALLDKVVKLSKADECTATLEGSVEGNARFARNNVSTSGIVSDTVLAVRSAYGKRLGFKSIYMFPTSAAFSAFGLASADVSRIFDRSVFLRRKNPENSARPRNPRIRPMR